MPKAILEFDLSDSHEHDLFLVASQAREYYLTLWELDHWLQDQIKEKINISVGDIPAAKTLYAVRDHLHEILNDRNLSLEILP